ncbi:hypothetical protein SSS_05572 [Sarcoptes scabiei]|uniref:Uncharacterized protein n=1 Tax=Sarcoptes scabiei TaxID=52283 RepID=A0A131ZXB7_SARSC|nr:hypothetical protein SSS_05572 [Sarcoptes scabiei]KPM03139.1 hypothetical protein QR98_0015690 [Sarcoptes scabiei]
MSKRMKRNRRRVRPANNKTKSNVTVSSNGKCASVTISEQPLRIIAKDLSILTTLSLEQLLDILDQIAQANNYIKYYDVWKTAVQYILSHLGSKQLKVELSQLRQEVNELREKIEDLCIIDPTDYLGDDDYDDYDDYDDLDGEDWHETEDEIETKNINNDDSGKETDPENGNDDCGAKLDILSEKEITDGIETNEKKDSQVEINNLGTEILNKN